MLDAEQSLGDIERVVEAQNLGFARERASVLLY